ncbi:hypothetical protein HQ945_09020 [Phyllobacterium sp. BT25]|uniref:Uncharacterized protein n=2 Tax=Phyllobacterium pellucidum TaxID=2740464 RepID=A0A849VU71_9HYPH|nr:hypothetical protein [Phyllobacterium pellucidum]
MGFSVEPCGSRVTCDPAPIDTDQDYLVEVQSGEAIVSSLVMVLVDFGFRWEGNEHYQDAARNDFMSWRRDDINLIVTANYDFASRHRAATHVCTRLNLQNKDDRIALFQAVLYGNKWSGKKAPEEDLVF